MFTSEYIEELGKRTTEILQGYFDDNNGWTVVKKTDEVLVERKPSDCEGFNHGFLYRGQCSYACPKETVYRCIAPQSSDSLRKKWDADMKDIEVLKHINPDLVVLRTSTNSAAMGLISPRDFTDLVAVTRKENYILNAGVSIESEEWPPVPKFVRGFNYPCGVKCMDLPGKPNASRVYTFIQADIRGSLPSSVVHSAIPSSMVGFFTNLKRFLIKEGHISKKA